MIRQFPQDGVRRVVVGICLKMLSLDKEKRLLKLFSSEYFDYFYSDRTTTGHLEN